MQRHTAYRHLLAKSFTLAFQVRGGRVLKNTNNIKTAICILQLCLIITDTKLLKFSRRIFFHGPSSFCFLTRTCIKSKYCKLLMKLMRFIINQQAALIYYVKMALNYPCIFEIPVCLVVTLLRHIASFYVLTS